jgi:hypothetical protein
MVRPHVVRAQLPIGFRYNLDNSSPIRSAGGPGLGSARDLLGQTLGMLLLLVS